MGFQPFRFGLGPAGLLKLTTAGEWREYVRRVEDLGYEAVCLGDHTDERPSPGHAAVAIAQWTTTLRAAIHVLNNDLRHPPVMARELCTIAMLTGGRFDAGLGAGWMLTDYDQVGLSFDPPGRRIARLDESAQLLRKVFTDERVSFVSEHIRTNEMIGRALLGDAPRPRLVMGGGGAKMLAVAATHADIISVNVRLDSGKLGPERGASATIEKTHEKLDIIRQTAGARFSELILQIEQHVVNVTDDRDTALARAATTLNLPPDEAAASPHVLVGSVSEIVERPHRLREDFGFSYICMTGAAAESFAPVVARLAGT